MPDQIGYFSTLKNSSGDTVVINDPCTLGGAAVNPTLPAFLALNDAHDLNVTGDGTVATVPFPVEVFDLAGNFATNTFTAPVTGKYRFSASVLVFGLLAAHNEHEIALVTTKRQYKGIFDSFAANTNIFTYRKLDVAALVDMDASETAYITVTISGGTKVCDIYGTSYGMTYFSGELVS